MLPTTIHPHGAPMSDAALHRALDAYNRKRLDPSTSTADWQSSLDIAHAMALRECAWIERERATVSPLLASVPTDPDAFVAWFDSLAAWGPGQGDPLFPWLASAADLDQMRWFLRQELAGEAGFEDLVAMTQVKLDPTAKLEMARNYWDEMGRGNAQAMHGPMLHALETELELRSIAGEPVWESLALANLMLAFASHRHLAYQSVGALGVVELTAPARCEAVNAGLRRLGVGGAARRYYAVHATIDVKHSAAWNRDVLRPLVAADPSTARPLAEGALLRLLAGARCFVRYRRELQISPSLPEPGRSARLSPNRAPTTRAVGELRRNRTRISRPAVVAAGLGNATPSLATSRNPIP